MRVIKVEEKKPYKAKNSTISLTTSSPWLIVTSCPAPSSVTSFDRSRVAGGSREKMRGAYLGLTVLSFVPCAMYVNTGGDVTYPNAYVNNEHGAEVAEALRRKRRRLSANGAVS